MQPAVLVIRLGSASYLPVACGCRFVSHLTLCRKTDRMPAMGTPALPALRQGLSVFREGGSLGPLGAHAVTDCSFLFWV